MGDLKETVDQVASLLQDFAKAKNFSLAEISAIRSKTREAILASVLNPAAATVDYERACYEFLGKVTQVRGMPVQTVLASDEVDAGGGVSGMVSASGPQVAQQFDKLLPKLKERLAWCVENYRSHAGEYFNDQIGALFAMIDDFLENPPPTIKRSSPKITEIKKEIRYLEKWNSLVYTWHAATFSSEVEYIFTLGIDPENGPIGAIWHYSAFDEQGDYRKTYDHKTRDKAVYLVESSWAAQKGFITADPERRLSSIDLPKREMGCMCSLQWIYSLSDIPLEFLTNAGRSQARAPGKGDPTYHGGEPFKNSFNQNKQKGWLRKIFSM